MRAGDTLDTRFTMNTKMVLTALGLATLIATPAFAENLKQNHYYNRTIRNSTDAYASTTQYPGFYGGRLVGTDPDPAIRSELQRDWSTYTSGN